MSTEEINTEVPVILKITSSGIKAEFKGTNGRKIFKSIGLESMSRVLNRDSEFDTGFLPLYGRHYMGIKRYIKAGDKEILFIEASPANRLVKYGSNSKEITNVRFPGLMMSVMCVADSRGKLKVKDTRLFSTVNPILRESDMLYRFPFGNIFQPDGRVCWGNIENSALGNIKNLTHAGSLLDTFLFSGMNSDLYGSGTRDRSGSLEDHLKRLQDLPEYPYDELISEISFKELSSLIKSKNVG